MKNLRDTGRIGNHPTCACIQAIIQNFAGKEKKTPKRRKEYVKLVQTSMLELESEEGKK